MYKRNCPVCNADIFHTRKRHMEKAKKNGSSCKKCAGKAPWNKGLVGVQEPWNKGLKGVQSSIKKGKKYEEIYGEERSEEIKNKLKSSLTGRKLTEEHKNNISNAEKGREIIWGDKISKTRKGKKLSAEHVEKLKENHVGMKGKKHSVDTLMKMSKIKIGENNPMYGQNQSEVSNQKRRLKTIKNIQSRFGQATPNYNPKACEMFNNMMIKNNCYIQHAENGGEYHIKELGYWVDGYDAENNIVYEFDEMHHFDFYGSLNKKDIIRQSQIEKNLKCEFVRIKESEIL